MNTGSAWVIFDADNTLWAIEHLYDAARERLVRFVSAEGTDGKQVESYQRSRDKELHETYGYSACRFARSFEDTLLRFVTCAPAEKVRHVRRLALEVFEQPVRLVEDLESILDHVASEYQLGIITAGERWVQERRLNDFYLRARFAAVDIVDAKSPETFLEFCRQRFVDPASSWVVGDSVRSDINPAKQAGLGAIHVDHGENWDLERLQIAPWDRYRRIRHLSELPGVPGLLSRSVEGSRSGRSVSPAE
jgi:putative hydrolase of the HAD superfamily